ncbi:SCO-spondin-like isoform X4 [Babylonia areolata]|uniref:SCO-spondin-like isoform X4 n=1 Tax=Babylonia areolata TaxID=304850 RepID=UPI003FD4EEBF
MRVQVTAACVLLLLLADLPRVPTAKINSDASAVPAEAPSAEEEDSSFGFITTTLSSLSNMLGLNGVEIDNPGDEETKEDLEDDKPASAAAAADEDGHLLEVSPNEEKEEDEEKPAENPEGAVEVDEPAKEDGFTEEGIQSDPAAAADDQPFADDADMKEDDRDKPVEKERAKEDDDKDKEEAELEKKLDEISEKEDEILGELDKQQGDKPPPSTLVRVKPVSGANNPTPVFPATLPGGSRSYGRGPPPNTSLALSSDSPMRGSVGHLASYMRTCTNCLVTWDSFQCPLNDMAIELKKWVTELEELLSFGCQLEGCDPSRKCCHRRDAALETPIREMTDMARQLYNTFQSSCSNCPGDGGWGEWCEWGGCSTTCGPGIRTRKRQCDSPSPKGGGRPCQGLAVETTGCMGPPCCVHGEWSMWSSWSMCPVTCGRSTVTRMRSCSDPSPNHCGRHCHGPEQDTRPCYSGLECCVDGNWGYWGQWTPCTATCDSGTRERRRQCDSPRPNHCGASCPGSDVMTEMCRNLQPCRPKQCDVPVWGPWEPWSRCPVTCGRSTQMRTRRCIRPREMCDWTPQHCSGEAVESQECGTGRDCCVHGNWGYWGPWSMPSVSCGTGRRTRRRRCDSPQPNECGRPCEGPREEDDPYYDTRVPCPPDCEDRTWGPWGAWSQPRVTCGPYTRERRRSCNRPTYGRDCGLQTCPGPEYERVPADTGVPCIPCGDWSWGPWSSWTQPRVTCGADSRERRRTCSPPTYGRDCGRQRCRGPDFERVPFDTGIPCIRCEDRSWGPWSSWTQPRATCGTDSRERRRTCNPPSYGRDCGLQRCPGPDSERVPFDTGIPCIVCMDRSWGPWGPWSQPRVTCGPDSRERRRNCRPPAFGRDCGQKICPGVDFEQMPYVGIPCPRCVDRSWGPWGPWSQPRVTCGPDTRERRRTCERPRMGDDCGRQTCPGVDMEQVPHRGIPCRRCEDRSWGPWGPWSQPRVTCGPDTRERRRSCRPPMMGDDCGRQTCPGVDLEQVPHQGIPCRQCVDRTWGPWGPWSQPRVTCGPDTRERRRTCQRPLRGDDCGRQTCPGVDMEQVPHQGIPCRQCVDRTWGPWGPWSQPRVTCGSDTRSRRRSCNRPSYGDDCGRQRCPGRDNEREPFNTGIPCRQCVDRSWGPWGPWSQPRVTCGPDTRERRRTCERPRMGDDCGRQTCRGPDFEQVPHRGVPCRRCVDRSWGPWGSWSQPRATCGTDTRERRRTCNRPLIGDDCGRQRCDGPDSEREPYDTGIPCVVCRDRTWGPWGSWSQPRATCGTDTRERRRTCNRPLIGDDCGRQRCDGPDSEREPYDTGIPCVVCRDRTWGPWGSWSQPRATCGTDTRERRRTCNRPLIGDDCGRQRCDGPDSEREPYDTGIPCVVCRDRTWGPWGSWSQPRATCGTDTRERRRTCNRPLIGDDCGRQRCDGPDSEREPYDTGIPCVVCRDRTWGPWGSWSQPRATCGTDTRERRRTCNRPLIGDDCGRQRCDGPDSEREPYDTGIPCVVCRDRTWGPWGSWSQPRVTCGTDTRERRRTCNRPLIGDDCGRQRCDGPDSEREPYDTGIPCRQCVDRSLGTLGFVEPATCQLWLGHGRTPSHLPSPFVR